MKPSKSKLRALLFKRWQQTTLLKSHVIKEAFDVQEHYPDLSLNEAQEADLAVLFARAVPRKRPEDAWQYFLAAQAILPAFVYIVRATGGAMAGWRSLGVLGVFPAVDPSASAKAAVSCGLSLLEYVSQIVNPNVGRVGLSGINLHVGVDQGTVVVSPVGYQDVQEASVYGDRVNSASHLCKAAARGTMRMSARINRAIPAAQEGPGNMRIKSTDDGFEATPLDNWLED